MGVSTDFAAFAGTIAALTPAWAAIAPRIAAYPVDGRGRKN
jgi:hypothetical protein